MRDLLRLIKANDRKQLPDIVVADYLANLNNEVHLNDNTVGPRCIVVWRRHKKAGASKGGGAHQLYTATTRDSSSPAIPTIACGMNLEALANMMMPSVMKWGEAMRKGEPVKGLDLGAAGDWALLQNKNKPDETLR